MVYRSVYKLTDDEMLELKESYFYQLLWNDDNVPFALKNIEDERNYSCPADIPNDVIYKHYKNINFVGEEFFCNH